MARVRSHALQNGGSAARVQKSAGDANGVSSPAPGGGSTFDRLAREHISQVSLSTQYDDSAAVVSASHGKQ